MLGISPAVAGSLVLDFSHSILTCWPADCSSMTHTTRPHLFSQLLQHNHSFQQPHPHQQLRQHLQLEIGMSVEMASLVQLNCAMTGTQGMEMDAQVTAYPSNEIISAPPLFRASR